MSAPAKSGPAAPVEKKKGLSKIMTRMKTVLKRGDSSKRLSTTPKATGVATGSSAAGPSTTKAATDEPTPVPAEAPKPKEGEPTKVMRSQIQADRAKKLGERFAVNIEPLQWISGEDKETFRIEKPIRMRIHRACHVCTTTFGGNKICAQCQHDRCKKCPRYPPKKKKSEKGKEKAVATAAPVAVIEVDTYWGLREELKLTKPNPRPGGQPLVRKKPMQRVRRNCHECNTLFIAGNKTCSGCGHIRCTDCPRDPAKKKKYPDGYPGDAFSSSTSGTIKYACSKCSKVFPPVPHPDSDEGKALAASSPDPQKCVRCGHERCADCPRAPPQRVEPAPDPEVLKSVQAKLAALSVSATT